MTKTYQAREFHSFTDRNSKKVFSDLAFVKCHFVGCNVSNATDPKYRSTIKNIAIIDCEQHGSSLGAAIVEDTTVDGFKTHGLFQTWGAIFKHVTLKGKLGRIMTSPFAPAFIASTMKKLDLQRAFDKANALYYSSVDWALDIREAQFEEADLRGIPARLVLRDAETQFILTREKALEGKWREVDLSGTHWKTSIEFLSESGSQDEILVAPKRHPRYRPLLAGLWALRDAGVVE